MGRPSPSAGTGPTPTTGPVRLDAARAGVPGAGHPQLSRPYRERVRDALSDPAAGRRALFPPDTVGRMLRGPDAGRTTLGTVALWQPGAAGDVTAEVEDLTR